MISNPVLGVNFFLRGISLLTKPGVRRWVVIPLLINTLLFALLFYFAYTQFGDLVNWLMSYLPEWVRTWLAWLLWPLFFIAAAIILFFTFTIVANIVGAPFNGYLAAAVERHLSGEPPPETGGNFAAEAVTAVFGELKKLLYFLLWVIPLLLISIFPLTSFLSPFLWALFGAWMLALEYLDYPMGNYGKTFTDVRAVVRQKRVMSLGFGGATMLGTLIPLFNFMVMPVAVAGATAYWHEQLKQLSAPEEKDKLSGGDPKPRLEDK